MISNPGTQMKSKNQSSLYGTCLEESNAMEGTGSKSFYTAPSHPPKERTSINSSIDNTIQQNSGPRHAKTGSIDDLRAQIARRSQNSKVNSSVKKFLNSSNKKRDSGFDCSFKKSMSFKNVEEYNCKNLK